MDRIRGELWARFDALPLLEVSSAEVSFFPRGAGFVQRVVDWLAPKNVFGKHTNDDMGWNDIEVNRTSVKNVIYHGGRDGKVALLECVPQLIKYGILLESNLKNERGLMSHIFVAKATIDDIPYAISYVVREDIGGRRYYDHSLTKITALDQLYDQVPTSTSLAKPEVQDTDLSRASPTEESTINILKKHLKVNTLIKKI